jgi:hypothetical protein
MFKKSLKLALVPAAMVVFGVTLAWADDHYVGTGYQFATLKDAMASSQVTTGDNLYVRTNITENSTVISKQVTIQGYNNTKYQVTVTGAPFRVSSSATNLYVLFLKFYTTATTFNLVQVDQGTTNVNFQQCDFTKSTTSGNQSCLADNGCNGLSVWYCNFSSGYHAIWADNAYTKGMNINKSVVNNNCVRGMYLRNTSTSASAYSLFYSINATLGTSGTFAIQTVFPSASPKVPVTFAQNRLNAPVPIKLGGNTAATIQNNTFSNCSGTTQRYSWTKTSTDQIATQSGNTYNSPCIQGQM